MDNRSLHSIISSDEANFPPLPDVEDTERPLVSLKNKQSAFAVDSEIQEDEIPMYCNWFEDDDKDVPKKKKKSKKKGNKKMKRNKKKNMSSKKKKSDNETKRELEMLREEIKNLHNKCDKYEKNRSNIYADALIQVQSNIIESVLTPEFASSIFNILKPLSEPILLERSREDNETNN